MRDRMEHEWTGDDPIGYVISCNLTRRHLDATQRAFCALAVLPLREAEASGANDDQQTYYKCVLTALEGLIAQHSEIDRPAMTAKREDWEKAYLSTAHGQPVKLAASEDR